LQHKWKRFGDCQTFFVLDLPDRSELPMQSPGLFIVQVSGHIAFIAFVSNKKSVNIGSIVAV
jgi:membrane protease subunit (stomatin/prohibitin family)